MRNTRKIAFNHLQDLKEPGHQAITAWFRPLDAAEAAVIVTVFHFVTIFYFVTVFHFPSNLIISSSARAVEALYSALEVDGFPVLSFSHLSSP